MTEAPTRIILVGVGGFGAWHLSNIRRLESLSKAKLIAMVDPVIRTTASSSQTTSHSSIH